MRCTDDLSPCDSRLVFFEYTEEHPLLLNNIGMAFKIKTYYRRPEVGREQDPPADGAGDSTTLLNALCTAVSPDWCHIACLTATTLLFMSPTQVCHPLFCHPVQCHPTQVSPTPASPTLASPTPGSPTTPYSVIHV